MLTVISGTNRPGAKTREVANAVGAKLEEMGVSHTILDLAELPQEIYLPSAYAEKPESFARFQEAIFETEGIVLITPEYNGSFPGVLKYFIDMLKFPESLKGKPAALIGLAAGPHGAIRSVEQMTQVLQHRSVHIFGKRIFLNGSNKLNIEGKNLGSDDFQERFESLIEGFVAFAKAVGKS